MPTVLVVDDSKINQLLLKEILTAVHPEYTIIIAANGREALTQVEQYCPDLVLLDVMMPDIDGFTVCERLKKDPRFKDIPVLLVTALTRPEEKVRGFQVGANDYIVKPINADETRARVEAHLRIKQYQDELKQMNEQLRRTQAALVESEKMSAVGSLAAGVAHEFNNILTMMKGYVQLCAGKHDVPLIMKHLAIVDDLIVRGTNIVRSLLNFSRRDTTPKMSMVILSEVIAESVTLMKNMCDKQGIDVQVSGADLPAILGYSNQLSQVFINLIKNAIEAMEQSSIRTLSITSTQCCQQERCPFQKSGVCSEAACVVSIVRDTGSGIAADIRDKIFEPFFTTKGVIGGGNSTTPGTGLGLSISYSIIEQHHGSLYVLAPDGCGAALAVRIPVATVYKNSV